MLSSPSFSVSVLSSPLSSLGKFSSPASPRSRFHPSCATATATSCYYTCTEERRSVCVSPQRMALCASLYEILGIPIGATSQEIKTAYRRLARVCHPDVAATDRKDSSAGEFMKIHAAYCTLSDPEKRAVYDRRFLRPNRPLTVGISGFSGYRGRNWETDQCW